MSVEFGTIRHQPPLVRSGCGEPSMKLGDSRRPSRTTPQPRGLASGLACPCFSCSAGPAGPASPIRSFRQRPVHVPSLSYLGLLGLSAACNTASLSASLLSPSSSTQHQLAAFSVAEEPPVSFRLSEPLALSPHGRRTGLRAFLRAPRTGPPAAVWDTRHLSRTTRTAAFAEALLHEVARGVKQFVRDVPGIRDY
jgi:hypothetical protein